MSFIYIYCEVAVKLLCVNVTSKFLLWIGKREKRVQNICMYSLVKLLGAEISEPIYLDFLFLLKLSCFFFLNHCKIYICLLNYFRHILQIQLIKSQPLVGVSLRAFHWFVFVYDVLCLLHFSDTFVQSYLAFWASSYWSISAHSMKRNESFTHSQSFVSSADWRVQ